MSHVVGISVAVLVLAGWLSASDIMDANDRLHSLQQDSLAPFDRIKTSLMPRVDLPENDVVDLVAFLSALRGS